MIGGVQTLNDFIICNWIAHECLLSANTEHICCPNSAFLNPFGWILKCVCLESRNLEMTPSDMELNCNILLMGFRF